MFDVDLPAGEVFGRIGPNGAGSHQQAVAIERQVGYLPGATEVRTRKAPRTRR